MSDIAGTFKNLNFLAKFINLILLLICLIIWCIGEERSLFSYHENGMDPFGNSQKVLFAHAVPAYVIILFAWVIAYFLDEEPGKWNARLLLITGVVLLIVTGVVAMINYTGQESCTGNSCWYGMKSILISVLCFVAGIIMILDILKGENVF